MDFACGDDGCETSGLENRECLPIPVGKKDPDFKGKDCLKFVRSSVAVAENCKPGTVPRVHCPENEIVAAYVNFDLFCQRNNLFLFVQMLYGELLFAYIAQIPL